MALSAETLNRIANYRAKAADGTLTLEEMREAIILMRENRVTAQAAPAAKRLSSGSRTKKPVDATALLNELDLL